MKITLLITLAIYAILNLSGLMAGLLIMNSRQQKECKEKTTRIGYVFPGQRLGCWLGSVPNE